MAKKDRVAYYEKQMNEWLKEAEKEGVGQDRVKKAVRRQFFEELRGDTMDAYEEAMVELELAPKGDVEHMIWLSNLGKSFVIDEGDLWVKPGAVLIMYEEGDVPSPTHYPGSDIPFELQDQVSGYLAKHFSPRVFIEDINNAVGMVSVESKVFGPLSIART